MVTHDPRVVINMIRNHLGTHDVPLCFFFGAGTSCSVRNGTKALIPAVRELTKNCCEAVAKMSKHFTLAWDSIAKECGTTANIEAILSRVRIKIDAVTDDDKLAGLTKNELIQIETAIKEKITEQVIPDESEIPENIPHDKFARWLKNVTRKRPVEIFTTNYDILLERSFERARIPLFDGFVGTFKPFFCPEYLENGDMIPRDWVRLWKLHGSVNWYKEDKQKVIYRGEVSRKGLLILPSHLKYDESRKQPYQSFINRMGQVLTHHNTILIICGYSFGDQHLNEIVYNALDTNIQTHAIALQFDDINVGSEIVKKAIERNNLIVIGRNAGVVKGVYGEWQLNEPITNSTSVFMDLLFDSDAEPDPTKVSLKGNMRVGDFARFTAALADMASDTNRVSSVGIQP
jgi:hypothetical protein